MAIFRKIHVQFWSDVFIQSLTPEQKFFFLYILTNERTRQCGIYEITKRQISFDTGYNVETIEKLIDFFENTGKVLYSRETNEIAVKNWVKFNDQTSPSVKACVQKELICVKDSSLITWAGYNIPPNFKFNPNSRVGVLQKNRVFEKYGHKCQKCKSTDNLSIDHIIPMAIGGQSLDENLRCLCRSCNSSRPVVGELLVNEVKECGFDFDYLYTLCTGLKHYEHTVRRMPQEEKEEEQEKEPEAGGILENEILDILNKIKTGTQIEGNPENKFVVMVVLKMVEIFKNKFPHYPVTPDFDYAGCLRIAYKIAEYKGWKKSEVINGRMDDCLNSWRVIVDFIHNDTWLATRSIPDISTDKEWARLVQKMKQPKKKTETTEKTAPSLTHLKPI